MPPVPFASQGFATAQAANQRILITVSAEWCVVCAAQRPILTRLLTTERFQDFVAFNVDWDTQKDLVRRFNAQVQGTIVVFKGSREMARTAGATREQLIVELLEWAL
ncbi:MAG: thioredoxin family protein [Alphaproteobacteria bacterium]|nr:thioredoxin family protein [Alphaproteobacteria bacterium]